MLWDCKIGETVIEEGIVGIVAGVITSWILFLGKSVWDAKVTPYFREVKYQGVKIDGPWIGQEKAEVFVSERRLFLSQSAHELEGSFIFHFKGESLNGVHKDFTLDFKVTGYMWEGYITLNFLPKDRRVTSYATALLKLHSGGQSLVGQFCFRDVDDEVVATIPLTLVRGTQ